MLNKESDQENWWKRFVHFLKTNISFNVIIIAALLLGLTTGVMYYTSQGIIQESLEQLVSREMKATSFSIRNHLSKVEVVLENMAWVLTDDLAEPDSLSRATYQMVQNNAFMLGSSICCIPDYYPQLGRWFEPYSVRNADGTIKSMQLGSANHDYTKSEFFTAPIAKGKGHWCGPYMDKDGAKAMITSYGVPIRDGDGQIVAVVTADISLEWLDDVMDEGRIYKSTQRFLVTGNYNMLTGEDSVLCSTIIEQIKADKETGYFLLEDEENDTKHAFYLPIGGKTDWMIICVVDDNEVFGELRLVQLILLSMVLASFILLGFIVWRSSRNLERLRKVNAEKERISSELRVASRIQQSMLPSSHLRQDDVEIQGSLVPAREVGGDLFDYFIRDEKLFFCIGDVSGKGTPSAMLMSSTRSLFRAFSTHKTNPAHIMQDVNEAACNGNDTNMFVTLFIGVLDLPTGRLHYCNAGHDAPFIATNGQWSKLNVEANLPIGLFSDVVYRGQETVLQPCSTLFLYTDGLTEAMNSADQAFGLEQVKTVLESCAGKNPKELMDTIGEAVHKFVGEAEQSDDLTMLAILYTPSSTC